MLKSKDPIRAFCDNHPEVVVDMAKMQWLTRQIEGESEVGLVAFPTLIGGKTRAICTYRCNGRTNQEFLVFKKFQAK
jgi:hypothetical protein